MGKGSGSKVGSSGSYFVWGMQKLLNLVKIETKHYNDPNEDFNASSKILFFSFLFIKKNISIYIHNNTRQVHLKPTFLLRMGNGDHLGKQPADEIPCCF